MTDTQIVLFPHSNIEEGFLKRLIEVFGSLTLCQPWFTEPAALSGPFEKGTLTVCFPPEILKPQGDFKSLLTEYQGWMMANHGESHVSHFAGGEKGEETWVIRKAIRDAQKDVVDAASKNALKWHLMLHLARSLEEDRKTADAMLQRVTKTKSPLAEAMAEGEPVPDIFKDLPLSAAYPYVTDRHLNLIFEAWFGLFGAQVQKGAALMTLDHQVMDHAVDLFDGKVVELQENERLSLVSKANLQGFRITRTVLPRLSDPLPPTDFVLAGLSGKTIIFVEREDTSDFPG